MTKKKTSYRDAGVDIDKAASFVDRIKPLIKPTLRKEAVGEIGHFGGLFHLNANKYKNPLLVSATDGVGTFKHSSGPINHCPNAKCSFD